MEQERIGPVCVFLIPVVRDSDRKLHPPILWRLLQDALTRRFGSVTGPEPVLYQRLRAVPGSWVPSGGQAPVQDLSRRYTIAIPDHEVDALRALLRRAGNSFDQRSIYLEVAGQAELLNIRPEDGFLEV